MADKEPAESNVIIFRQFISLEGLAVSRDTVIHIAIDTITKMNITSSGIFDTSYLFNLRTYIVNLVNLSVS